MSAKSIVESMEIRRMLMMHVLYSRLADLFTFGFTPVVQILHSSEAEDGDECHFLICCHLQTIQQRHRRHQHNNIGEEIYNSRHREGGNLVSTRSPRNSLVPVICKGPTYQTPGQYCSNSPGYNHTHCCPGNPHDPIDGEDAKI